MSPTQRLTPPRRLASAAPGLDTPVRAIMRAGVISVPDDASVRDVQRALVAHRVHAVLVVDSRTGSAVGFDSRTGSAVGWATTRGVLEHMLGTDASLAPAALAVTEPAEGIPPSATAEEALRRMLETGCTRLLIRRHSGAPADGVVSEMDLVRLSTSE